MRRPRDWGQPCPNAECPLCKHRGRGNVSAVSMYLTESGKRRIFRCQRCKTTFSDTRDTVFFDLRTSEEKVMMALKMLLVRVDLSGISFVLGVHAETVLAWLVRAAAKAHESNAHWLRHRLFRYDAQHGFFNEQRAAVYHMDASKLAWERMLGFLNTHL